MCFWNHKCINPADFIRLLHAMSHCISRISFRYVYICDNINLFVYCKLVNSISLRAGAYPMSVKCFSYQTYIGISLYHTLCSRLWYEYYIGVSPYYTLCSGFHTRHISVSVYITLCAVGYDMHIIPVLAHITLSDVIGIGPYHILCCGFHYMSYIDINLYRIGLLLNYKHTNIFFYFRVIWTNTALVQ